MLFVVEVYSYSVVKGVHVQVRLTNGNKSAVYNTLFHSKSSKGFIARDYLVLVYCMFVVPCSCIVRQNDTLVSCSWFYSFLISTTTCANV